MAEDPTARALRLAREEWTEPYREAISTALAELTGLKSADLDTWEAECLEAAQDVLDAALNPIQVAPPSSRRSTEDGS